MSVASRTFNYSESCQLSHEFLRRICSKTPTEFYWAGDLIVSKTIKTKQSEQNDMRGGAGDVEVTFPEASEECGETTIAAPEDAKVEETEVRDQADDEETDSGSFKWIVKKASGQWDEDIFAASDLDCGVLTDGGDIYGNETTFGTVDSLCGTIHRDLFNPSAHFLDNRRTKETDPDNGLLIAIRNGINGDWEVRYAPTERVLTEGLIMSDDVTTAFTTALSALGMTHQDVFEFGMI